MNHKVVYLVDRDAFYCSVCLDLLKDPVTIPCGHSYCINCITSRWNRKHGKRVSCPQCRKTFTSRPVLVKDTMLAHLVEHLKKTGLQTAPADHCSAGPEDVACDVCTGRKLKAVKSCIQCLASYCEKHMQPHYDVLRLKKHNLVEPSKSICSRHDVVMNMFCRTDQQSVCYFCTVDEHKGHDIVSAAAERTEKQRELQMSVLQNVQDRRSVRENICSHHDEVMNMFCRTDQQSICYLCSVDGHKGHDIVSAAAERTERQRELQVSLQQRVQDREGGLKLLQQEVEAISRSADKTVEDSEKIFTKLTRLIQKRSSDVKQQVRSQQETEVSRVKEQKEKLEQEITEMKRKAAELEQLLNTEDHNHFLHKYHSLSALSGSTHSSSVNICPLSNFEEMTAAVSEVRDKLQDTLRQTNVSLSESHSRAGFLQHSCKLTLNPNTANRHLKLSEGNRKVTRVAKPEPYSDHPGRFTELYQVLSRESLIGRFYWEVDWSGEAVYVAVTYKSISRAGSWKECLFGRNEKSWALYCHLNGYIFWHNNIYTNVLGPPSSRVGVYLDHSAGILSFYSVSETMTLLHRVQTTFTEPLYAGFWTYGSGSSCELLSVK